MEQKINRIKVMLAKKGKTNKWLSEQVGKDHATVSKWCTNVALPTFKTMIQIAKVLEVNLNDLVRFDALPDIEKKDDDPALTQLLRTSSGINSLYVLKGLTCIGCDRTEWNGIHGAYQGTEPIYVHTIDPAKSELYGGQ